MYATKLLLAAAAAAVPALGQGPGVNVYFGQSGTDTLGRFCDAGGFDHVTLAYVTAAPEADPSTNYPATNFGNHCDANVYVINGQASRLQSNCKQMAQDIKHCQSKGIKVLLSVGGTWGQDPAHDYYVSTTQNGQFFAEFLFKSFGPTDYHWTGPRPFDLLGAGPTVLDGFDFDLQADFSDTSGYVSLLTSLRMLIDWHNAMLAGNPRMTGTPLILTASPLCPLADGWSNLKDLVGQIVFDKLWIQFYDNDICAAGTPGFNYEAWETLLATGASKDAKLYVGLPPLNDITGYQTDEQAIALADSLKDRPSFGGMMIHEVSIAKNNPPKGGVPLYLALTKHFQQGVAARDVPSEDVATNSAPTALSTKTKNATVLTTETVYAIGTSLTTPLPADSTGFVFVTTSTSTTVSATQTEATPSESSSVTSAGVSTSMTWSNMAIVFMALVYVIQA